MDDEDELAALQNHLEAYLLAFLSDLGMQAVLDTVEDTALLHRMHVLSSFVEPDMLGINPAVRNDMVWAMAQDSLRRMNSLKMPSEKVACVVSN